tara:strand:- start:2537 stop:2782 length:246 start_codon:yes stop_codon:yes gene_type:complete
MLEQINVKNLFLPLTKENCNYFYFVSVISFIVFAVNGLVFAHSFLFKNKTKLLPLNIMLITPFLGYFVNRLLYSMCVNSLN